MDLDALMLELKKGNQRALVEIYSQTKRAVFSVAYGISNSKFDAEDVMQDTYVKICGSIHLYKQGTSPKAWICRIARNIAIDKYRKNKRNVPFDETYMSEIPAESQTEEKAEADDLLRMARETLNETEYQILYMHTIGDMQHQEIAKVLDMPHATVRWNYSQAIGKLKKRLKKEEEVQS